MFHSSIRVLFLVIASTLMGWATPDLRIEVTTFCCSCGATDSFCQNHFDALNIPNGNGKFFALTTDARRWQIASQGNVLAVYQNDLNTGWTTNSPEQSAANFNQYALNNHTSTGPRPDWMVMNEISTSQWQNSAAYRDWLVETVRLLHQTFGYSLVIYAPFANPANNGSSWSALSSNAFVAVENYLSGEEIKAQNFSTSWCQSKYQSSIGSYASVGVPREKLILGEHFAQTISGTGWGRSGISSNEWDQAIVARSQAARNANFAGFASYAWVNNGMMVSDSEMIHFEGTYVTNTLPFASGLTPPYISLAPQNLKGLLGSSVTLTVYPAGTNHLEYQWRFNGSPIAGATLSNYTITNVQSSSQGYYSVVLSNAVGVAFSSNAFLTVQSIFDPFDYPAGANLPGQTNGEGLAWYYAGLGSTPVSVTNGSLPVPGLVPSTANSISFGVASGPSARLPLVRIITNGTVYFSFPFKVIDLGGLSTSGGFFAAFNNSIGNQSTTPTVIGAGVQARASGNGFQVGLKKASSGSVFDTSKIYTTNDIIFVVGSYTFNGGSTIDDEARLWINPDPATFGAVTSPPATISTNEGTDITANQIASFVFFRRGTAGVQPSAMLADELRISTSWAGVTPVAPLISPPTLLIQRSGSEVILFWSTNAAGFNLQTVPSLSLTNLWQNALGATGMVNEFFTHTNVATNQSQFFRLFNDR